MAEDLGKFSSPGGRACVARGFKPLEALLPHTLYLAAQRADEPLLASSALRAEEKDEVSFQGLQVPGNHRVPSGRGTRDSIAAPLGGSSRRPAVHLGPTLIVAISLAATLGVAASAAPDPPRSKTGEGVPAPLPNVDLPAGREGDGEGEALPPTDLPSTGAEHAAKLIAPLPPEPPALPAVTLLTNNPIDPFIVAHWQKHQVRPAKLADDFALTRRIYLDLSGLIPTFEQVDAVISSPRKDRFKNLIDELLDSPRYADHWAVFWGDLLREQEAIRGAEPGVFRAYIRDCLSRNVSYDRWVRDMIEAQGTTKENAAAAFIMRDRANPDELTIATTQVFLGTQLKCAMCHDHPFEAWKQSDFVGMRTFFDGTRQRFDTVGTTERRGQAVEYRLERVSGGLDGRGTFMTGATLPDGLAGRAALAALVTARDNPYFARVAVNRLWAQLMGRGLVDPPDAFGPANPPSHPELLDWLAHEFIAKGYDLKHVIRLICNSRTYQLASTGGLVGDRSAPGPFFERMPLRRMTAEQLHDSILVSCGLWSGSPLRGETPRGGTADKDFLRPAIDKPYPHPGASFLGTFNSHDRDTIHERDPQATIPQALELLNGDLLNYAVRLDKHHPVRRWLAEGDTQETAIRKLFVQTLGREPTRAEADAAASHIQASKDKPAACADVHWALINTREFMFVR